MESEVARRNCRCLAGDPLLYQRSPAGILLVAGWEKRVGRQIRIVNEKAPLEIVI